MRVGGAGLVAVLVIAGCGGDPTQSTEYADLLAERNQLLAAVDASESKAAESRDEMQRQLAEVTAQLEQAEADAEAAANDLAEREQELAGTQDRVLESVEVVAAYADLVSGTLESWFGLSPVERRCVSQAVAADGEARDEFSQFMFAFDTVVDDFPTLTTVFDGCNLDLAEFLSSPVLEGNAYGDNPELDALQDRCAMGDGAACDELYFASTIGSEYERFAATCGERFESETDNAGACEGAI